MWSMICCSISNFCPERTIYIRTDLSYQSRLHHDMLDVSLFSHASIVHFIVTGGNEAGVDLVLTRQPIDPVHLNIHFSSTVYTRKVKLHFFNAGCRGSSSVCRSTFHGVD